MYVHVFISFVVMFIWILLLHKLLYVSTLFTQGSIVVMIVIVIIITTITTTGSVLHHKWQASYVA